VLLNNARRYKINLKCRTLGRKSISFPLAVIRGREILEGKMEGQMEDQEKLLLNEREAAQLLAMSIHFLRRDRISRSSVGIPYIRIGTAVRYRRVDLEEWIGRQIQVQPSGP
jgi:predicted DNA-binding transcriptional regulator AlpA